MRFYCSAPASGAEAAEAKQSRNPVGNGVQEILKPAQPPADLACCGCGRRVPNWEYRGPSPRDQYR
jgi:hypothetical protein